MLGTNEIIIAVGFLLVIAGAILFVMILDDED